jgi:hypothetical protein
MTPELIENNHREVKLGDTSANGFREGFSNCRTFADVSMISASRETIPLNHNRYSWTAHPSNRCFVVCWVRLVY